MSNLEKSAILSSLPEVIAPTLKPILERRAGLLSCLTKKRGSGQYKVFTFTSPITDGYSIFTETSGFSNSQFPVGKKAKVDWSLMRSELLISDHARDVMAGTNIQNEIEGDVKTFKRKIGELIYGINLAFYDGYGVGGKPFGLNSLIAEGGTVYGIDRSASPEFNGNVASFDGYDGYLSLEGIEKCMVQTEIKCGIRPDVIICNPTEASYLRQLAIKANMSTVSQAELMNGIVVGTPSVVISGAVVKSDLSCPAGTIYGLNTSEVYAEFLPPVETQNRLSISSVDEFGNDLGMVFALNMLGRDAANQKYSFEATYSLVCENPGSCFKWKGFKAPAGL